jgi:hypothetical protein
MPWNQTDVMTEKERFVRQSPKGVSKGVMSLPLWSILWGVKRGHVITFVVNSLKGIFWSPPDVLNSETYRLTEGSRGQTFKINIHEARGCVFRS